MDTGAAEAARERLARSDRSELRSQVAMEELRLEKLLRNARETSIELTWKCEVLRNIRPALHCIVGNNGVGMTASFRMNYSMKYRLH